MAQPRRVETTMPLILTDAGGFPVDNIAYWKTDKMRTANGAEDILLVQFRTGGFIHIPGMTIPEFNSLVYGEPY